MISRYLEELDAELRGPRRARARILAEVRDHLHEAVAAGLEAGLPAANAERRALESFGRAVEIAAAFHEQLASASAHRAALRSALVVAAMVGLAGAESSRFAGSFPWGAVVWVGVQVAAVAAVLGVARSLRYRATGGVPAARLPDLYRANALAVGCAAVAALAFGLATVASTSLALTAVALLGAAGVAARSVAASYARACVLAPAERPREDALDDLLAAVGVLAETARGWAPRLAAWGERNAAGGARELRQRLPWLDLRGHPWRFCASFALACGIAAAAQHALVDGGMVLHPAPLGRAVLAGIVIAALEAAAVVTAFAAFGRLLGIRR